MKVDLFDFDLPQDRIAQQPASPRDASRLLHVTPQDQQDDSAPPPFTDRMVRDLPDLLAPGDIMVVNDTRVLPARLSGKRLSADGPGAKVEVTLHKPEPDGTWRAFARPAKKLKPGDRIAVAADFHAEVIHKGTDGEVTLAFAAPDDDLRGALEQHGVMPLPPYIKREAAGDPADKQDYQTLFAARDGAVAAPTASLHFTPGLMDRLAARGVLTATLTLHVGAGTFLPVKADDTQDHIMHAEWGEVSEEAAGQINAAKARGGRVLAVGSTALRLLESAASENGRVRPFQGETDIFITPGYRFKTVDLMLTNFHLPRSTLFMLVAAFSGLETMQHAYAHAIGAGYRFYSYGDACLLSR